MSNPPRPIHSVSTTELYSRWATVYDSDGNILQSLDDLHLPPLLDQALTILAPSRPLNITELGCGTGRNTLKLLALPKIPINHIIALDLSPAMLAIAQSRCTSSTTTYPVEKIFFQEFDALSPDKYPDVHELESADLLLSTLVLEHLPLPVFFRTLAGFAKKGSVAVVSNMHAEMGRVGQAGFVDKEAGVKVRGESFVYEAQEVVEEGAKWGFEVEGEVMERGVEEGDLRDGVVGERGMKWLGVKCWFGMVMRFVGRPTVE